MAYESKSSSNGVDQCTPNHRADLPGGKTNKEDSRLFLMLDYLASRAYIFTMKINENFTFHRSISYFQIPIKKNIPDKGLSEISEAYNLCHNPDGKQRMPKISFFICETIFNKVKNEVNISSIGGIALFLYPKFKCPKNKCLKFLIFLCMQED